MPAAARVGDATSHGGVLQPAGAATTVLVGGAPAAVVGTMHACALPATPPHPVPLTPVLPPGSATVLVEGRPAARQGDLAACGAQVVAGAPTVLIGG